MIEKNILVLFQILDYFSVKTATYLKKVTPSFPATPSKNWVLSSHPLFFWKFGRRLDSTPLAERGRWILCQSHFILFRELVYAILNQILFVLLWHVAKNTYSIRLNLHKFLRIASEAVIQGTIFKNILKSYQVF